jgi:hypothetical protein
LNLSSTTQANRQWSSTQTELQQTIQRNTFGLSVPLRQAMEIKLVNQVSFVPRTIGERADGRTSVTPYSPFLRLEHYPSADPTMSLWRSCRETTRVWMLEISWVPRGLLRRCWMLIASWRRAGGYKRVGSVEVGYEYQLDQRGRNTV